MFEKLNKNSKTSFVFSLIKNKFNLIFSYTPFKNIARSNLYPIAPFNYFFKKKVLKTISYEKFNVLATPFYITSLIKFFEFCTGKKIILKINTFLNNSLTYVEKTMCLNWAQRLKVFRKMLGPRLFLAESLEIIYLSFKLRDPFLLSN
jgi:hypothetical protein